MRAANAMRVSGPEGALFELLEAKNARRQGKPVAQRRIEPAPGFAVNVQNFQPTGLAHRRWP
jgi:hypothetical protein